VHTLVIQVAAAPALCSHAISSALSISRRVLPARNHQDVERRRVRERVIGQHAQPLRAANRIRRLRDRDDAHARIELLARCEHLPGAREVELLGVGKEQDAGRVRHGSCPHSVGVVDRKRAR
jgi:hypothetical protein